MVRVGDVQNEQNENEANEEEEWRVCSHLLGKCYLDFICPRRMPANALEPSRALTQKRKSVFLFAYEYLK